VTENITRKYRGLLFNEFSMKALVAGRKTQTRRPVKAPKWADPDTIGESSVAGRVVSRHIDIRETEAINPPARPGDIIWSRETWRLHSWADDIVYVEFRADGAVQLADKAVADPVFYEDWRRRVIEDAERVLTHNPKAKIDEHGQWRWKGENSLPWKPGIHLPMFAGRTFLELVDIGAERVQQITEEDAIAEGIVVEPGKAARAAYAALWDDIHGKNSRYSWDRDPLVWRYEFGDQTHD